MPCFALPVCTAFALSVFISTHEFSHFLLVWFSHSIGRECASECVVLFCLLVLTHNTWAETPYYSKGYYRCHHSGISTWKKGEDLYSVIDPQMVMITSCLSTMRKAGLIDAQVYWEGVSGGSGRECVRAIVQGTGHWQSKCLLCSKCLIQEEELKLGYVKGEKKKSLDHWKTEELSHKEAKKLGVLSLAEQNLRRIWLLFIITKESASCKSEKTMLIKDEVA